VQLPTVHSSDKADSMDSPATNLLCWAKLDGVLGTVVVITSEFQHSTGQIALRVLTRNCRKILIGLGSPAYWVICLRRNASSLSIVAHKKQRKHPRLCIKSATDNPTISCVWGGAGSVGGNCARAVRSCAKPTEPTRVGELEGAAWRAFTSNQA
jgi:hypothetical protein